MLLHKNDKKDRLTEVRRSFNYYGLTALPQAVILSYCYDSIKEGKNQSESGVLLQ